MRLSEQKKKIIVHSELCARSTVKEISRASRLSQETVRYHLNELRDQGVISFLPVINPLALGYSIVNCFFSPLFKGATDRASFIEFLIDHPAITWVCDLSGDYQYGISIVSGNLSTPMKVFADIQSTFNSVSLDRVISIQSHFSYYSHKFLGNSRSNPSKIIIDDSIGIQNIDALDKKMLFQIAKQRTADQTTIARELGQPISTIQYRVKKLERLGVIGGYTYEINLEDFGYQRVNLLISLKHTSKDIVERMHKFAAAHILCTYLIHSLGSWDFELGVEYQSPSQISEFLQSLSDFFGDVLGKVTTLHILQTHKYSWFPASY